MFLFGKKEKKKKSIEKPMPPQPPQEPVNEPQVNQENQEVKEIEKKEEEIPLMSSKALEVSEEKVTVPKEESFEEELKELEKVLEETGKEEKTSKEVESEKKEEKEEKLEEKEQKVEIPTSFSEKIIYKWKNMHFIKDVDLKRIYSALNEVEDELNLILDFCKKLRDVNIAIKTQFDKISNISNLVASKLIQSDNIIKGD